MKAIVLAVAMALTSEAQGGTVFRKLDDHVLVAGQIAPADIAAAKAAGVVAIINNRPDDEQPGQPSSAEIEAAAKAAGLAYTAIPVTHAGFSANQVDVMASVLTEAKGPVLAFCRSGTRSTLLWALARTKLGDDKASLETKARGAGYDLSPVAPLMDMLTPKP